MYGYAVTRTCPLPDRIPPGEENLCLNPFELRIIQALGVAETGH